MNDSRNTGNTTEAHSEGGSSHKRKTGSDTPGAVTLSQSVTDRLRSAILEGHFMPSEKLQEVSLSAMLNASRTPVRAALHSLTVEGLLEYVPNRGYSVRSMDIEKAMSAFDVRGALEGLAARLAAQNGLDETAMADFRWALEEGDRIIDKGRLEPDDQALFSEVNVRLHGAILRSANNQLLSDMMRICQNRPISSDRTVLWSDYRWVRRSHDDHHRLFDAILTRDGARAEQLMREHILAVKVHMKQQLEQMVTKE
jgi:GntR family transcriptional regulator of vanillate catabolism